jgi:hypothetical protein
MSFKSGNDEKFLRFTALYHRASAALVGMALSEFIEPLAGYHVHG